MSSEARVVQPVRGWQVQRCGRAVGVLPVPGTVASSTGATTCVSCVAGKFTAFNSSVSCLQCDRLSYAPAVGSTACLPCSVGYIADDARSTCVVDPDAIGALENQSIVDAMYSKGVALGGAGIVAAVFVALSCIVQSNA